MEDAQPELGSRNKKLYVTVSSAKWASIFGGEKVAIGPRIVPYPVYPSHPSDEHLTEEPSSGAAGLRDATIRYKTCSWQKTAFLLFAEYIGLAVMSYPQTYSQLGWVLGLASTCVNMAFYQYTALALWNVCLRHAEVRDICDIGFLLFGSWGRWCTAIVFVLNNSFVMALHVLIRSEYINTVTAEYSLNVCRTVIFSLLVTAISWMLSLPRTFEVFSIGALVAAAFTVVSVLLTDVFLALQGRPDNFDIGRSSDGGGNSTLPSYNGTRLFDVYNITKATGPPLFSALPPPQSTFKSLMTAFLNISYTIIGQVAMPSFITEMKDPRDFPKALWMCTISQTVLFVFVGISICKATGSQYMSNPAFGALKETYKSIAFSFMLPTTIILGALYASLTARFVFFRAFAGSKHLRSHTAKGWSAWMGILGLVWTLAFLVSQLIPFFSSLVALVAAIFGAFTGYIFWGWANIVMRHTDRRAGLPRDNRWKDYAHYVLNAVIIVIGAVFYLGIGTFATVAQITDRFRAGEVSRVFSCKSDAL